MRDEPRSVPATAVESSATAAATASEPVFPARGQPAPHRSGNRYRIRDGHLTFILMPVESRSSKKSVAPLAISRHVNSLSIDREGWSVMRGASGSGALTMSLPPQEFLTPSLKNRINEANSPRLPSRPFLSPAPFSTATRAPVLWLDGVGHRGSFR